MNPHSSLKLRDLVKCFTQSLLNLIKMIGLRDDFLIVYLNGQVRSKAIYILAFNKIEQAPNFHHVLKHYFTWDN